MADQVVNTTVNGVTLSNFDTLLVGPSGYVYVLSGFAVNAVGNSTIAVAGTIMGDYVGVFTGSATGSNVIDVLGSGTVYGTSWGLFLNGTNTVRNSGEIRGGSVAINSVVATTLSNSGLIEGPTAITGAVGKDTVRNSGEIIGDVLLGSGDDSFHGVGGTLDGVLDGGAGSDTVSFAGHGRGVFVDLQVGLTFDGAVLQRTIAFENAVGTGHGDFFFGSAADNTFDAGPGGADFIGGYGGSDTVSYASSIRPLIVDLTAQATFDGVEGDTLVSIENAIGSRFADTIVGDGGANVIDGGPGGADTLNGLGGTDTVSYASSERGVIIDLASGASWDGLIGDQLIGFENASGSAFDDQLYGDGAANTLTAGFGLDVLIGGGGADRFVMSPFEPGSTGPDRVSDFTQGADKIVFRTSDGYSASAAFVAAASPAPTGVTPTFLYFTGPGVLHYDPDGTGGQAAWDVVILTGAPAIGLGDLLFVA